MRKITIILLMLSLPLISRGQEVSVKSWFDTNRIIIGDQVSYNIEINHPANLPLVYPFIADTLVKGIEVLDRQGPDTTEQGDIIRVELEYLVTSFDTGFYEVQPVFAESRHKDGVQRYYSDYTALEVLRTDIAPADSTQLIFDIAGPRKARITMMEILPWVLLISALVLAIAFIYRFFGKRSKKEADDSSFLPQEPIHIIALRELDKLEKMELWQDKQHKRYYSLLTEILRTYIDRRYGICSMEMTSSETLESLSGAGFDNKELFELLRNILTIADLTKFAKYRAVDTVNLSAMEDARKFVRESCISRAEEDSEEQSEGEEVKYE